MIVVHLADGFEEIEALTVVDLLRRANIDVKTASIMGRKNVMGAHDIEVEADMLFEDVNYDDCEMMVLPGGGGGATRLDEHTGVVDRLQQFFEGGKWIAAICAAPMILGHQGILRGKRATIYEGMEAELVGATFVREKVVVDEKIVTSRGPGTAMDFALKIIELIKGSESAAEIDKALLRA
jgi:4-methyl-5(b-hydroxyethyl)-thiazole monophosphate biosynthesis